MKVSVQCCSELILQKQLFPLDLDWRASTAKTQIKSTVLTKELIPSRKINSHDGVETAKSNE